MELTLMLIIAAAVIVFITMLASTYKIVPASHAHLVYGPFARFIGTGDTKLQKELEKNGHKTKSWYFKIPVLRNIREMDLTIKDISEQMETFEKDQARYKVGYSLKYRIKDVQRAAETFTDDQDLRKQLISNVEASVRAVTVQHDVNEARKEKKKMGDAILAMINPDLDAWGLEMVNFVLVDFDDTAESKVISNLSKRREVAIESETRQMNAEKNRDASVKEAEASETSEKRQIEKEETVAKRLQQKTKAVAEQQKEATEKELDVTRVKVTMNAQIEKEKKIIEAEQQKEVEEINKEQKKLAGEGDKLKAIEIAVGKAAEKKEELLAEAAGKEKLQETLSKFDDRAIKALTAEKIIDAQKEIAVEVAKALANADVRVFAGNSGSDKAAFDLGAMIQATSVSSESLAQSILNKIARQHDLGFTPIDLKNDEKKSDEKNGGSSDPSNDDKPKSIKTPEQIEKEQKKRV